MDAQPGLTSADLVALSAAVEPWIAVVAGIVSVGAAAGFLWQGRPRPAVALEAPIPPRAERLVLGAVLLVAIVTRVVGWDDDLTPPFWFTQVSTLHVDDWLTTGTLWPAWLDELRQTQVIRAHESPIVMPVLAGLQAALGPRFGLPVLSGAFFGTIAVWLAWALGRRVHSPVFGLVFAALLACSPMQLTWSRLSGLFTAGTMHVLLALLVGWEAGRRRSVLLAIAAGAVAWTSVYGYSAARVAIPLALLAILGGSQRAGRLVRGAVLAGIAMMAGIAVFYALHGALAEGVWPRYGGFAGGRGERTLADLVSRNLSPAVAEARRLLEGFFTSRRTSWNGAVWQPGIQNGGLVIVPIACLGIVGLISLCARARRQWLWLVLAAAGFAIPALSQTTSRRALVFDAAWCAFAAQGLLTVVDRLGARLSRPRRAAIALAATALLCATSVTQVFLLNAALPPGAGQHIPFAEAGFGDGVTCRRCLEAARAWERDMAGGDFVVLFDNDIVRENRSSPGGLAVYGKIAARAAGTPGRFAVAYALMAGWDIDPPKAGALFDRDATDFAHVLAAQLERAAPARIVWHFERPTAWERRLARRLADAGGRLETFSTPLSPMAAGLRVVTPWDQRAGAFQVLWEVAAGLEGDSPCVALSERDAFTMPTPVFSLAADDPGMARPPQWLATSVNEHRYKTYTLRAQMPIGARVTSAIAELVTPFGQRVIYELPSLRRRELASSRLALRGLNCAAFAGGQWWILDPWTGRLASAHPARAAVPTGAWIGVAGGEGDTLVLASADQEVVVFDLAHRAETARFPARVGPSARLVNDECTPIAVGADWIGTVNLPTTVLSLYDRAGHELGTRRLDRLMRPGLALTALAGAGNYLGVAAGHSVRTFELRVDPACRETSAAPAAGTVAVALDARASRAVTTGEASPWTQLARAARRR